MNKEFILEGNRVVPKPSNQHDLYALLDHYVANELTPKDENAKLKEQVIKSGVSESEATKLLRLVNKYGGSSSISIDNQPKSSRQGSIIQGGGSVAQFPGRLSQIGDKNSHNNQSIIQSDHPSFNKNNAQADEEREQIPDTARSFHQEVNRNQEERLRRVQQLKQKLTSGISQAQILDDNFLGLNLSARQIQPVIQEEQNDLKDELMNQNEILFQDQLSQMLLQEDPELLKELIYLLPRDDPLERERILTMINRVLNGNPEIENEESILNQYLDASQLQQENDEGFNVFNRLFAYAQAKQHGLIGRIDGGSLQYLPRSSTAGNYSKQYLNETHNSQSQQLSSARKQKPGHFLYQEFLDREQRVKAVQEAQRYRLEQERIKTKVNMKSHQLAYKKLERDIHRAVMYIDYEGTEKLNVTQIGQLLYILSVFKYLYNQEHEQKKRDPHKYVLEQPLNAMQIKIEERKMREEEFLIQLWLKVNPLNSEFVDSHIVLEFLKLVYDPYSSTASQINLRNQEQIVREYVTAIRKLHGLQPDYQIDENGNEQNTDALWTISDLIKALRYLTDNYAAFKSGTPLNGGLSGIKIPNDKQRRSLYDAFKDCTFKPLINKKSEHLEKLHWASFFNQQHQRVMALATSNYEEERQSMIGKIVNQSARHNESDIESARQDGYYYDQEGQNLLNHQMEEMRNNPGLIKVGPTHRVELLLEKDKLKQEKIRHYQQQKEAHTLRECTFKPQINKGLPQAASTQNLRQKGYEVGQTHQEPAHERLWELSKAKKMNLSGHKQSASQSAFDLEAEELQECTFAPQINKKSRQVIQSKRKQEFNVQDDGTQIQQIKGYEETVKRLKKAKELKDLKKSQIENLGKAKTNYSGNPTVMKPFLLQTEQQRQLNLLKQAASAQSPPLIDVEITIATGKIVHLTLREGDDIKRVTKSFCKTYALNEATKKKLEDQLQTFLLKTAQQNKGDLEEATSNELHEDQQPADSEQEENEQELQFQHINTVYQ